MTNLGDIDPVGGFVGLAAFIVAILGLSRIAQKSHSNAATAWLRIAIALAVIGALILLLGILTSLSGGQDNPRVPPTTTNTSPPTPTEDSPQPTIDPPSPSSNPRSTPPVTTPSTGPIEVNLEILTSDYRRMNLEGTEYSVFASTGKLDFRFGWAAQTSRGDLETDDCVVNTKFSTAEGTVLSANPSNRCSQNVGSTVYGGTLEPGSYIIEISLQHPSGTSVVAEKLIRVDAN